jgi:hypothetical protein
MDDQAVFPLNAATTRSIVEVFPAIAEDAFAMNRIALIVAASLLAATAAFAQQKHPADIAAIDAALRTAKITSIERAEVLKYRNLGQQLHNAGKHGQAEVALQKAKSLLSI